MKNILLAIIAVSSILSSNAHALTLRPGDSFEYSFHAQDLTHSTDKSERYDARITWDTPPGNEDNLFHFEMFENTDFSESLQSFDAFMYSGGVGMSAPYDYPSKIAWQDIDGAIKFTATESPLEIENVTISIRTPNDAYTLSFAPQAVPEASSFAFFALGISLITLNHLRRKR